MIEPGEKAVLEAMIAILRYQGKRNPDKLGAKLQFQDASSLEKFRSLVLRRMYSEAMVVTRLLDEDVRFLIPESLVNRIATEARKG